MFDPNLGYLLDDNLTILCEMKIPTDDLTKNYFENQADDEKKKIDGKQTEKKFTQLSTNEEESSDVTFQVGNKLFKANQKILSARSPVFRQLFEEENSFDKKNCQIVAHGIEEDIFQEILHFIYTDEAPNIEKMATALLIEATDLELDKLKILCEDVISKKITIDNAAQLLDLAIEHEAGQLKKACEVFMGKNALDVVQTDGFKNLIKSHHAALAKALSYSR